MAKGYGTGQMTWGGLKPGIYQVSCALPKRRSGTTSPRSATTARLALTVDADAMTPLEIDVACSDTNGQR